jgi:hypothetical protein
MVQQCREKHRPRRDRRVPGQLLELRRLQIGERRNEIEVPVGVCHVPGALLAVDVPASIKHASA